MSFPADSLPRLPPHVQLPLLFATNILALAVGPRYHILRVALSAPVLAFLVVQSVGREWDRGWGLEYGMNCFVMTSVMVWVEWVVLGRPDKEGWRKVVRGEDKGRGNSNGVAESNGAAKSNGHATTSSRTKDLAVPTGFLSRLWWATRLTTTNRYVGWSCEAKNVPVEVAPGYPRSRFILRKSLRAALFYLLKDAIYSYTASTPHGTWLDIAHRDPVVSFAAQSFLYRFRLTWVYIVLTYVSMELMNTVYGIVSVGTGLAAPVDCPSMFGSLSGLWSVRQAWSVYWHQQMRHICSAPGIYLVRDILGLQRGSFASKYLQLFIGFGVSGFVHGAGSMLCHASFNDNQAMKIFLVQAVIILVEDHVIKLGKKCGCRDVVFWRIVGFAWTVLAIGASFEPWTGELIGHGLWVHDREVDIFGIGPK